jgi:uncharacterized protein YndB with AHSA1/START domain
MTSPNLDVFLNLRRTFSAPRELVFRAWTEPQALEGWFRPMGQQAKVVELDLRVGGGYCFEFRMPDGELGSISGRYIEIARPDKLVFTWQSFITDDYETLVTLEFVERDGKTEILLAHEHFPTQPMAAAHQTAWNWMMDSLTAFVN